MKVLTLVTIVVGAGFFLNLKGQDRSPVQLFDSAENYYRNAEYSEAAQLFEEAASLFIQRKDSASWAEASMRQGDALLSMGNVQEALDLFLFLLERTPENISKELNAQMYHFTGRAYRELEQYDKSKEIYLKGIELAEASGDSILIARLNNNISYPYLYSDEYDEALFHQIKAKSIYESIGQNYRLSFVLNGIFLTLRDLGLHKQAEKYIRQSLEIRKGFDNPNLLDIAYHNMAASYKSLGQIDSAIVNYQKSLELSRMLENPYDITQTLLNIGSLYKESGENETALLYFNEALEFNRKTNRPISIANNLSLIGRTAAEEEDYKTAESFYMDALSLLDEAEVPAKLAETYFNLARMEVGKGDLNKAEQYVEKGFLVLEKRKESSTVALGHRLKGEIFAEQGHFEKSLDEYKKYHKLYMTEGAATASIWPDIYLARAYQKTDSDSAFILANQAFKNIDETRNNVSGFTFKAGFFSEYAGFYSEVAGWHIEENQDFEKAFELVEGAKARVLMDELAEAESKLFDQLDESTLIRKRQMQKQIDKLYSQITESTDNTEKEQLRNELKDIEFRYQTLLNSLRREVPGLEDLKYPEPMTANEAMSLLDDETAVLEYSFANDKLIRFTITQDKLHADVFEAIEGVSAKEYLTNSIRSFRTFIVEEAPDEDFTLLYSTLIPDTKDLERKEISNFIIVPGGVISFVPFEALQKEDNYLIQSYNVKYLPSLSMYPFIKSPHRATNVELLALAGSGFEGSENGFTESRSQASFASLPSTLLEVDSIAVNFKETRLLKNEDVTEATLKSFDLSQFRYIHFATHAEIDEVNPSQSGLVLSKKTDVETLFGEDGHLNSTEISGLRLNADLVTLSACETGMGKVITGEGLLGLQRSFLTAGSSSVMVSLWNIFDRSTAVFMSSFYKSMLEHKAEDYGLWNQGLDAIGLYEHPLFDYKAKALREAKLAMIDHPYYNKPVHWAPFILIGK